MKTLEKMIGPVIVLTIAVVMIASVLPHVFPYLACLFVFVLVGRAVWFYTGR